MQCLYFLLQMVYKLFKQNFYFYLKLLLGLYYFYSERWPQRRVTVLVWEKKIVLIVKGYENNREFFLDGTNGKTGPTKMYFWNKRWSEANASMGGTKLLPTCPAIVCQQCCNIFPNNYAEFLKHNFIAFILGYSIKIISHNENHS